MVKKKMTYRRVIVLAILVIMALISVYPMWYTLICSLSSSSYVDAGKVWVFPRGFSLDSYRKILEDNTFFYAIWVTVKRVVVGCSINMLLLCLAAYPLFLPEDKFPEGIYIKWFFLINTMFSGGLIPSYFLIRELGLFDSFWALVLPGAFPLGNIILMINFFRNVPFELNESATLDGANPLRILFSVYVPLSKASLACILLFQFVGHWNSYMDGLLYINDNLKQPLQTYIYNLAVVIDYSMMDSQQIVDALEMSEVTLRSAKVIVALIPIMLIYPFLQKHFVAGMHIGAVKG